MSNDLIPAIFLVRALHNILLKEPLKLFLMPQAVNPDVLSALCTLDIWTYAIRYGTREEELSSPRMTYLLFRVYTKTHPVPVIRGQLRVPRKQNSPSNSVPVLGSRMATGEDDAGANHPRLAKGKIATF
jgi:hypothetical protein